MRITSIDIKANNSDNIVNLSFRDPTSQNVYVAKEIVGLDADEITPKYYGSDSADNGYYDLSIKQRNVVIKISLNPNFASGKSYAELRDDLYKLVSSSRTGAIQLLFKDGVTTKAAISGFVSKFESPNFTRTPEVQLTIKCTDSMLKAVDQINVDITDLDPTSTVVTDELSTSPHGFRFGVLFNGTTVDFSVQDAVVPNWAFEVNLTGSPLGEFSDGDELHFSSEYNNRYLYLIRGFDIVHLVDKIIPTSIWPIIFPGENTLICSDSVDWDYITYFPTYWGV